MKQRTLKHLRPKPQPEQQHNVYVVLLDAAVGRNPLSPCENPKRVGRALKHILKESAAWQIALRRQARLVLIQPLRKEIAHLVVRWRTLYRIIGALPFFTSILGGALPLAAQDTAFTYQRRLLLKGHSPKLKKLLLSDMESVNRSLDFVEKQAMTGKQPRLFVIRPGDSKLMVSRITKERGRLVACADMAKDDVKALLGR